MTQPGNSEQPLDILGLLEEASHRYPVQPTTTPQPQPQNYYTARSAAKPKNKIIPLAISGGLILVVALASLYYFVLRTKSPHEIYHYAQYSSYADMLNSNVGRSSIGNRVSFTLTDLDKEKHTVAGSGYLVYGVPAQEIPVCQVVTKVNATDCYGLVAFKDTGLNARAGQVTYYAQIIDVSGSFSLPVVQVEDIA